MSTTLFFLVPIGLLAVFWSLCFVGCVFQTGGLEAPYSNDVLSDNPAAYWPLGDPPNMPLPPSFPAPAQGSSSLGAAADLSGNNHVGSYITPPDYPSGIQAVQFSKPIAGPTLNLQQGTIVPGDVTKSGIIDKNLFAGSTAFNGGYVSIPWSSPNELDQFTLEAWIKPSWMLGESFWWMVFSAFINNTGFRIFINNLNHCELVVGTGVGNMPAVIDTMVGINPTSTTPTYIALTCDTKGNMQLWINPQGMQSDTSRMPPTPPPPNWTSSGSTGYVAISTTQAVTFFIGAGANDQLLRTPTMNPQGAPLYPFQGKIQDVALYNAMLDPATILEHFTNGSGG